MFRHYLVPLLAGGYDKERNLHIKYRLQTQQTADMKALIATWERFINVDFSFRDDLGLYTGFLGHVVDMYNKDETGYATILILSDYQANKLLS